MQTRKLPGIDFFEVIVELVVARSANEREVVDGGHAGYLSNLLFGFGVQVMPVSYSDQ